MLHRIILTPGMSRNLTKNLGFSHNSKNFSTISVFYHSHSHADGNSHSHSHSPATSTAAPSQASADQKTEALLNQLDAHGGHSHSHDSKPVGPGKKFLHSHSHPEFPELDDMDLSGEDFEFTLNEKKKTVWTTVKDFFDPHTPIHKIMSNGESGHSHGHSHSHSSDPEAMKLYDPKNLANEGVKITWIGLGVNASMAVSKFFGGIYFHSQALIADAVHSVGDLVSDVLTLSTVKYSTKPPSDLYPFGYGKIETLGSLFVSAILLFAGLKIGWASLVDILSTVLPHNIMDMLTTYFPAHSHTHVHVAADAHAHEHGETVADAAFQTADINAAWIALASIGVKEWLFRATRKVGEKMDSKVLIANAWHHRVDSLTSVVALATITSGYFLNIYWLDSIGGLIVSLLVMKVGVSGVVQSLKELIDKAIPKDDPRYAEIEDLINVGLMKQDSNLLIRDMNILPSGTNLNVNVKLGVGSYNKSYENKLTLDKMGDIGKNLEEQLRKDYAAVKNVAVQFVSNEKLEVKEEEKKIEEVKEVKEEEKKVEEAKEEKK